MNMTNGDFKFVTDNISAAGDNGKAMPEAMPIALPVPINLGLGGAGSILDTINDTEIEQRVSQYKKLRSLITRLKKEHMEEGVHYGKVVGIDKPFLMQPGADMILAALNVVPMSQPLYTEITENRVIVWVRTFFFSRSTGQLVYVQMGACTSWEKKYRYRKQRVDTGVVAPYDHYKAQKAGDEAKAKEILMAALGDQYNPDETYVRMRIADKVYHFATEKTVLNPDPMDQFQTHQAMSTKRSKVAGVIGMTGTSDVWSHDETGLELEYQATGHMTRALEAMCKIVGWAPSVFLSKVNKAFDRRYTAIKQLGAEDAIASLKIMYAHIMEHKKQGEAPTDDPPDDPLVDDPGPAADTISAEQVGELERMLVAKGYSLETAAADLANPRKRVLNERFDGAKRVADLRPKHLDEFMRYVKRLPNLVNPRSGSRKEQPTAGAGGTEPPGEPGAELSQQASPITEPAPAPADPIDEEPEPMITKDQLANIKSLAAAKHIPWDEVVAEIKSQYQTDHPGNLTYAEAEQFGHFWLSGQAVRAADNGEPATPSQRAYITKLLDVKGERPPEFWARMAKSDYTQETLTRKVAQDAITMLRHDIGMAGKPVPDPDPPQQNGRLGL